MTAYLLFLGLVAAERLLELRTSRRNAEWALGRGGIETGRAHFRMMTVAHAAFLPACAAEAWLLARPFLPALGIPMLGLALAAQGLRWWAAASLGRRWNVRVIVVPGMPAVDHGPYRFVRHPNYLAVLVEGIAVPLVRSAWITALLFTAVNAVLLRVRVRVEEEALAGLTDWGARLGPRPRFLPRPVRR